MTKREEFAKGWSVLLAASFGAGVGVSSLLTYNSGLFAHDLSGAIGLGHGQFGLIYFLATIAVALAMPAVGWLVDRIGVRVPVAIGAAGLSLAYLALAILTRSVTAFAVLMFLLGFLGAGSSSVGLTRAVTSRFHAGRGLALGITQAGIGVSAAVVPVIVGWAIRDHGWQAGFLVLAGLAALGIPSALIGLRGVAEPRDAAVRTGSAAAFARVRRNWIFRLQYAAFALTTLTFVGVVVQFVPMLRDQGIAPLQAASYAGLIGVSVLLSRLVAGWLADIVHAPWLGAAACAGGAVGCLLLTAGSPGLIPTAAIAIGCAVGTEIDLLGYLTAHYFGLETYGRAYAWQYAGVICASGASPAWIGWVADHAGFTMSLYVCVALALVATGLFLALPRKGENEEMAR